MGIYSKLETRSFAARLAATMKPVCFVLGVTKLQIMPDILSPNLYHRAIAAAATVEMRRPGGCLFTVLSTPRTTQKLEERTKSRKAFQTT